MEKFDYNNPENLRAKIEKAWISKESDIASRIIVGSEGGLAYRLFDDIIPGSDKPFPNLFEINKPLDLDDVIIYINYVNQYLEEAHTHGNRYGFNPVRIRSEDNNESITRWTRMLSPFYEAGLGKEKIENNKQFLKFLHMAYRGKDVLGESYDQVTQKALRLVR
jgi:hypothetical protein